MRVLLYTGIEAENAPVYLKNFFVQTFSRLAARFPQHHFILIHQKSSNCHAVSTKNLEVIAAGPVSENPLARKWWYDIKIPRLLKKFKADVFISADDYCSLRATVPQCILMYDLSFLENPEFKSKTQRAFLKRYTPYFLRKAKSVAVLSGFLKNKLIEHYGSNYEKATILNYTASEKFLPQDEEEKKQQKKIMSAGCEYFFSSGFFGSADVIKLLKAFSVFKKMQQSNMKLVLELNGTTVDKKLKAAIETYKYRNDLVLVSPGSEAEKISILGSAYAFIQPASFDYSGALPLQVMQVHVPVIASAGTATGHLAADAALFFNPADFSDLAAQMMLIYKDENLRARLIEKGKEVASVYNRENALKQLWQAIENALH